MNKKEIESFIKSVFVVQKISTNIYDKYTVIRIETDNPQLSYYNLKLMSEFFGTDKIDICDFSHTEGCPTCDYGATTNFNIRIEKNLKE